MTPDALLASRRATALALAALTYANAVLTYFALTRGESATLGAALAKLVDSLPWLLPVATPLAILFALALAPPARRAFAAARPRGRVAALAAAIAAFLLPAALLTEAALALRDGWNWPRLALQLACGAGLAAAAAALLDWKTQADA